MKKGFTLMELMIVSAVIAILAAIAVPTYRQYFKRTENVAARTLLQNLALAEIAHSTDIVINAVGTGGYIYVDAGGTAGVEALARYGFRPNPRVGFVVLPAKAGRPNGFVAFAATDIDDGTVYAYDSQYLAIASPMDNELKSKLAADLPDKLNSYIWSSTGAKVESILNVDTTTFRVIK